jgi:hypothetical protein
MEKGIESWQEVTRFVCLASGTLSQPKCVGYEEKPGRGVWCKYWDDTGFFHKFDFQREPDNG